MTTSDPILTPEAEAALDEAAANECENFPIVAIWVRATHAEKARPHLADIDRRLPPGDKLSDLPLVRTNAVPVNRAVLICQAPDGRLGYQSMIHLKRGQFILEDAFVEVESSA